MSDAAQSTQPGDGMFVVEEIIDKRINEEGQLEYKVKWEGYSDDAATWEPYENVKHLTPLLEKFEQKQKLQTENNSQPQEDQQSISQPQKTKKKKKKAVAESQFILRVPPKLASQLRKMINENKVEEVQLEFNTERNAKFRIGKEIFDAKLVDLPCITEAYKSIDCMTYYKAGDVSQMIQVVEKPEEIEKIPDKSVSGLTPSTKNIYKHWEKDKLNITKEDIQNLVNEFIKKEEEDLKDTTIEIYSEEEDEGDEQSTQTTTVTKRAEELSPISSVVSTPATPSSQLSPQISPSDTPRDDDNISISSGDLSIDSDTNIGESSGQDEMSDASSNDTETPTSFVSVSPASPTDHHKETIASNQLRMLIQEKQALQQEVNTLLKQIEQRRQSLEKIPNPILKSRFEKQVTELQAQLNSKQERLRTVMEKLKT